jgi:hypothetical protein
VQSAQQVSANAMDLGFIHALARHLHVFLRVDFGFNVGLEGSPEDFSVSIGTGS